MKNLSEFNFNNIFWGENINNDVKKIFSSINGETKKVLLITGKNTFDKEGWGAEIRKVLDELKIQIIQQVRVHENPQINLLDIIYDDVKVDCILAIGGGSVIDFAKLIKLKKINAPLFSIYTMLGSGTIITPFAIYDNDEFKIGEYSPEIIPEITYVNQYILEKISYERLLISSSDIIAHALESYYSKIGTPETRKYVERSLGHLTQENIESKNIYQLFLADIHAAYSESQALVLFPHAAGHYLTYKHDVPHAIASLYYLNEYLLLLQKKGENIKENHLALVRFLLQELSKKDLLPTINLDNCQIKEMMNLTKKYMSFAYENAPIQITNQEYYSILKKSEQSSNLIKTLLHAKNTDLYKNLSFDKYISVNDISKLPLTTKADLRNTYPYGGLSVSTNEIVEMHTTSGTTGVPTVSFYTEKDLMIGSEYIAKAWHSFGINSNSKVQFIMSYGLFSGAMLNTYALQKIGAFVLPAGIQSTEKQVRLMIDFEVDTLVATPGYLMYLSEYIEENNIPRESLKLVRAIAAGEIYSDEVRTLIEERLGIKVYDHYGLCEVNTGIAYECSKRAGLHVLEDYVHAEIIDPNTLEVLPVGQVGELVLTTLQKEATPVLRYRTGDVTYIKEELCECGDPNPRIARIHHRLDDIIFIKGIKVSPGELRDLIYKNFNAMLWGADMIIKVYKNKIKYIPEIILPIKDSSIENEIEKLIKSKIGIMVKVTKVDKNYFQRDTKTKVKMVQYLD